MKTFLLLSFFTFTALQSVAQQDQEKLLYLKKVEKFRKMKNTGAVLTVGGGILFVVGIATLLNSSTTTTSNGYGSSYTTTQGNPEAGLAAYLFGSAGLGAGIPLWIIGKNNHRKYTRKLESVSAGAQLNLQAPGFKLTYRF